MESLDFWNVSVHCHESCKWDCQVVSEGTFLSSLILKVINKFWVFTILSSQNILELKNWSINLYTTMFLENFDDCIDDFSSDGHLVRVVISGTFGALNFKFMRFLPFCFLSLFGSILFWLFWLLFRLLCLGFLCWKRNISQFEKLTDLIIGKGLGEFFLLLLEWLELSEEVSGWDEALNLIFWHEV